MDINNIKLNKILDHKAESKKQEKENFQIPEDRTVSQGTLNKFRNAAAAYAMAALSLSSCMKQEQYMDTSGLEAILTQMLQQQKEDMEALQNLMKQNNSDNKEIIKLLQDQYKQQQEIYGILTKLYGDFANFDNNVMGALYQIIALAEKANANDEEFKAYLQEILNSGMDNGAKLDAILDANKEQNQFILALTDLVASLGGELGDKIKDFHEDYKNGDASKSEMLENIFKELLTSNELSKEQLAAILALQSKLENGSISESDVLEQIRDILANIDKNVADILVEVKNLSAAVNNLAQKVEDNQDESLAILKNINDGIGSVNTKLKQIENNQQADNKVLVEISNKMDKISADLTAIGDKTLTKDDVKDLLGPLYTDISEIKDKIDGIGNGGITAAELEAILNGYKTDLTKTNSLIETLTKVVQNLSLGDGSGSGSGDVSALADILNQIKTNDEMSRAEINAMLAQILEKLGSIDDSLKALQATASQILENQEEFMAQALEFGADYMEEIQKIANNTGNLNKLDEYADAFKKALVEAEKTRQEQLAVLKAILEKEGTQGSGGPSISIDELKEIIPDYTEILNEIKDALGNVITSSDLENFYMKTQPDLTKTNSLIETLTKVVQNKEFSGGAGSADMSRVESLLGEILDAINNKKLPTESQMQALIEAAQKVVANTTQSDDNTTRVLAQAIKDIQHQIHNRPYYHPGWDYSNGNIGENFRA